MSTSNAMIIAVLFFVTTMCFLIFLHYEREGNGDSSFFYAVITSLGVGVIAFCLLTFTR